MSTEREKSGATVIYCDSCTGDAEYWQGDLDQSWSETWSEAKEEGWVARPANGDWIHQCPECVKKPEMRKVEEGRVQSSRYGTPYRGYGQFGPRRK